MEKSNLYQTAEALREKYLSTLLPIPEYTEAAGRRMFNQHLSGPLQFEKDGTIFSVDAFSPMQQGNHLEIQTITSDYKTTVNVFSNPAMNGSDSPKGGLIYERRGLHLIADSEVEEQKFEGEKALYHINDHLQIIESIAEQDWR